VADTGVVEVGMDQLALRVRQLVEAIESYRRTTADVLGVGMSGTNALAELWFHGPSTPTSLADRVGLTSPSVTALVDRLEAAGMVARRRHPADRRSVIIELTHTGSATLQTAVGLVSDRISAAVEQETPEQIDELQRMLEQIAASLRSGAEDRSGIAAALGRQALPGIGDPNSLAPAHPPLSADLHPSTE
jgi:DNA-binding MarR family transcriptional regulator